jgi:hypothetical protein
MKVTDEMITAAITAYHDEYHAEYPEIRHDMRQAIEAAMQAAWTKFDINDPTTYPSAGTHAFMYLVVTTNGVQPIKIIAHWDGRNWFADQRYIEVSYWMQIPAYKGE